MRLLLSTILLAVLTASPIAMAGVDLTPPDPNKLSDLQRKQASALFQKLKATPDDHEKRTEIIAEMVELGRPVAQKMFDTLDRQWEPKWKSYQSAFAKAAKKAASVKSTGEAKQEIKKHEAAVQSLRKKGDGLTKDHVKKIGDPALKRLRELKILKISEVLAAEPRLEGLRSEILATAKQRDLCIEQLVLLEDEARPFGAKDVTAYEEDTSTAALGPPSEYIAILKQNAKIGASGDVPADEVAAIRDMNQYRLLIGLRPCAIDPKLCDACRGHSQDMAERNFFAHDSPVPGKETPWKRAKLAGTSGSSENIYMGSTSGKAANKAWWYSPGHHRNMLNPGNKVGGMGHNERRWTQMFR